MQFVVPLSICIYKSFKSFFPSLHTASPSYEYYVSGFPQHAKRIRIKNTAEIETGIKVKSVSVLYSLEKRKSAR